MKRWQDRYWNSADGLRLHYRDYPGPHDRPPLLCIPGLTRNAADFEPIADHVAGQWRVIAVDLRGRGLSDRDPNPANYTPPVYATDLLKLLDQLGIADAVFVGTSLGGLVTMLMAWSDSERIAGALINDIGPDIDREGLEWISTYVGKDVRYPDWSAATAAIRKRSGAKFPYWSDGAWDRFARRVCREEKGEVRFDYDMALAENFRRAMDEEPADLWPGLAALSGVPVTVLRGELSDLLSVETARRMGETVPGAEIVTIPATGHTPNLEEPESLAALDRLLTRVLETHTAPE